MIPTDAAEIRAADRRWVRAGIAGLVLSIICASAAFAALSQVLGTSDETAHMDYAYQIWMGHLPVFEHGLLWHPPTGNVPPVQWESQHPPLFYLLAAPIVGPLINGGHWLAATMAGRGFSVVIAAACVLALSWAGSLMSTRRPRAWAIAVPAVVSPIALFMRVGGSFYIDNLAALFTILALGVGIMCIRTGLTRRRVIAAAALGAAGMLTDASFGVALLVLAGAVVLGGWINDRRPWRSLLAGCVPLAAAAAASGWFYIRNKRLTGTYSGSHPEWAKEHLHRVPTSSFHVLTSSTFWKINLQLFRQSSDLHDRVSPIVLAVLVGCAVLGWLFQVVRRRSGRFDIRIASIVLVLVLQTVGTLIAEIGFAAAGGGINARYLLPALLPIGCLLAAGVMALPRYFSGVVLAGFLAVAWSFFIRWAWSQSATGSHWTDRTVNNVPWAIVLILLAGLVVGAAVQAISFGRLSGVRLPVGLGRALRRRAGRSFVASG